MTNGEGGSYIIDENGQRVLIERTLGFGEVSPETKPVSNPLVPVLVPETPETDGDDDA